METAEAQVTEWDAQGKPITAPSPASSATEWDADGKPIQAPDLTANPKGEGIYQMRTQGGQTVGIPYSNITPAMGQGHFFANPQEEARYQKDFGADRSQNDPYIQQHYNITPGGVARGVGRSFSQAARGAVGLFAPPQTPDEAAVVGTSPVGAAALPAYRAGKGYLESAGSGLSSASRFARTGQPVRAAATALGAVNPLSSGATEAINQDIDKGTNPGEIIGEGIGYSAQAAAPEVAKVASRFAPGVLRSAGENILNRTVGATSKDFARGANPGRGYIEAGGTPAFSMEGLAEKAAGKLTDTGQKLRDAYDGATSQGKLIPTADVEAAIDKVINDAKNSASGPGVMADPAVYDELRKTFEPSLQSATAKGGFTPRELWDIRKNMDDNLNWGDQSKLNLTKTQQRVSGSIGGLLKDAIPETRDLARTYQDLTKFRGRAAQRALTGQSTLSNIVTRGGMAAAGALAGAGAGRLGELGGAAAGAALDSIPVKSAVGTALGATGKALEGVDLTAAGVAPALGTDANKAEKEKVGNTNENEGQTGTNQNLQTPPPATPSIPSTVNPAPDNSATDFMATGNPKGLVEPGNLPIWNRPVVQNDDGTHSSEFSTSFQDDKGREVLVPTIVDGKFLTPDGKKPAEGSPEEKAMFRSAWQHYQKTGEHLGKFDNPSNADAYSQVLHSRGDRAPEASPQSHVFSISAWLQDNPGGDVGEAKESAEKLGYQVVK